MILFFDTSALVKFFYEEEGTEAVTKLILDNKNELWISELARLEFISAVYRRFRIGELNKNQLNIVIDSFEKQIAQFNIEPLGHAVIEEAILILKNNGGINGIKSLDALHLGTFSLISEENWVFVATDDILCSTAKKAGFNILNPIKNKI